MNYKAINKKTWNEKTDVHIASEFYNMTAFRAGHNTLKSIELALLGDVKGKSILHLQCHFGQDTLSLARMGAEVTGIDLSDKAILRATELAKELDLPATFVCCDVYDTPKYVTQKFDIVFTTYGTIGWLPDLDKWASVVAQSLKPGGRLVFAEFHPVVWMFDDDFKTVAYPYFNREPIVETTSGTYADRDATIVDSTVSWNHHFGEVIQALIDRGLQLTHFSEYDYSPHSCFKNIDEFEPGKFRIKGFKSRLPMVYALEAVKPAR